jgi:hypothetical protein
MELLGERSQTDDPLRVLLAERRKGSFAPLDEGARRTREMITRKRVACGL